MIMLGTRLRELRRSKGITVRQFAGLIEKTAGYVSRIEARGEIPSPKLLCKIASVYDIAPEELLKLAKQSQLERTKREIETKHESALEIYRKETR